MHHLDPWSGEHLEGLEDWFEANRSELSFPPIEAADLREAIRKNRGKAPGPDAWKAEHLVDAPDTFYQCLADLWKHCLQLSLLPEAWLCVRVTGIPNSEPGSLRPLSIESVVYQAGMSAITRSLSSWAASWAPPDVTGALRGRSTDDLFDVLFEAMHTVPDGMTATGIKLNLRTAFDYGSRRSSSRGRRT